MIQELISDSNKATTNSLEILKEAHLEYACRTPTIIRKNYEEFFDIIERKTNEINEKKVYIDECINNLENWKNKLSEMEKIMKEVAKTANEGQVGTLHGLCRDFITKNEIPVGENEETVLNFPYDEKKEIEKFKQLIQNIDVKEIVNGVGGKKNNTKRKNNKAKKGNNKKSKKQRFR